MALDVRDDIALGIELPLQKGPRGYFRQTFETINQAKTNLKNLLLTSKGERPMQPEFGSNLRRLVFDQSSTVLEDQIKEAIDEAVDRWLPYVVIEDVQLDQSNDNIDRYIADITVIFSVVGNPDTFESITIAIGTP